MERMKRLLLLLALAFSTALYTPLSADVRVEIGGTVPFNRKTVAYAQRDTCTLYMDIYTPVREMSGKPAVLYMFGGGFIRGDRRKDVESWFKKLNDCGYTVVSIDYRLGLKGSCMKGLRFVKDLDNAVRCAVEDLFAATDFLLKNGSMYGINANNLVLTGSSAGAISVLQAEYEICNGSAIASVLPPGFNYKAVIPFAGAILDMHKKVRFPVQPCPLLIFYGKADKMVPIDKISLFGINFTGSSEIAKILRKDGYSFSIVRYEDRGHEVSEYGEYALPMVLEFIENVTSGKPFKTFDLTVDDPDSPSPAWGKMKPSDMYKTK